MTQTLGPLVPPVGRRWEPLSPVDRRVAGVLVEKAKTTPEAYPLSLNAVVTACNQKSNRCPQMELDADAVQAALDRLRGLGAVGLVQGTSRIDRFRHLLYEWLGVDKVELAVMAELLLRGAQTEGELRGRAARMEPIVDLNALRPVLDSLKSKGLVLSLNRQGRAHVVTHALYPPNELECLCAEHDTEQSSPKTVPETQAGVSTEDSHADTLARGVQPSRSSPSASEEITRLHRELRQLQEAVVELRADLNQCRIEIEDLRQSLGA